MNNENNKHLENLTEIRSLMEQSSRFISLSGLSGIIAGILALIGAFAAFLYFDYNYYTPLMFDKIFASSAYPTTDFLIFLFLDAGLVFILALGAAILLTTRKAKKQNSKIWTKPVKMMITELAIPLLTGGFFTIVLLYYGEIYLLAPSTLIFYGLSLVAASKYTLKHIRYLGISEILLGIISCFIPGYGMISWAIGFGVFHIIYGIIMYNKYDRQ